MTRLTDDKRHNPNTHMSTANPKPQTLNPKPCLLFHLLFPGLLPKSDYKLGIKRVVLQYHKGSKTPPPPTKGHKGLGFRVYSLGLFWASSRPDTALAARQCALGGILSSRHLMAQGLLLTSPITKGKKGLNLIFSYFCATRSLQPAGY